MPRVLIKAEVKRSTKKRAAKKKATKKTVRTATILVNGSPLVNQKLYGYSTHASYVKRQQRAYRVLDEIKQREISSVSNILKKLAGVKA